MEAKELIIATWVLVIFTGILAGATVFYAIATLKLYRGSNRQVDALKELTKAILQLPSIAKHMQTQEELAQQRQKEREKVQKEALTGLKRG
jgi:hypothetical protein